MKYIVTCDCGEHEIEKSMDADWPVCAHCGKVTQHVFTAPVIHYNAPGFTKYDHARDMRRPIDYEPEG